VLKQKVFIAASISGSMFVDEMCEGIPDAKERAKCRERAARTLWNLLVSWGRA
jgi:hypothetical protein